MSLSVLVLESVGSCVDDTGLTYPLNVDGTPDVDNGVSVFETTNEWIENLNSDDLTSLISFLDDHIGWSEGSQIHGSYEEWRTETWSHWENVNNCYMNLEAI